MTNSYDVIVAGLGAMGSLTLQALARRGQRVVGLDRFAPPHSMGSSHGHSRIIREAYFEDPRYVPLVQRAYDQWAELEVASGATLFRQTGGLMLGAPDGVLVRGALLSATLHHLEHEVLSADQVRRRFPAFHPSDDMVGVWEPRAGILNPEACIAAALQVARAHHAEIRTNEPLIRYDVKGDVVEVTTTHGTIRGKSLILAVGAWTGDIASELGLPLVVQRNVQFWIEPARRAEQFTPAHFPIFISEFAPGKAWYGFPNVGDGLKVALHHHGPEVHPDSVSRTVTPDDAETMLAVVKQYMPDAAGSVINAAACLYTNTPDEHFVIGRHPAHPSVIIASPCSGHGFKFASAIGEILANLAMDQTPGFDLSLFAPDRFAMKRFTM